MRDYLRSDLLRVAGFTLLLVGCGDPTPNPTDASVRDAGATQLIGPAGGVIFAPGLTFTVPPGALVDPTSISITRTDTPVPAGYVGYSPVWRFAPEGLTFAQPATIDITFSGDSARAGLYWSQPGGGYERLTTSLVGSRLVGPVSHFSLGFVGDRLALDAGTADATVDRPDAALDAGTADVSVDHPDGISFDAADVLAAPDVPDVLAVPAVPPAPAPRPIAPLSGSHVPTRRPGLRWSLPAGVAATRVTLCRDRALTTGCVTFDATGTTGAPAADLAPGVWFWGLRGLIGGVAGGPVGPVWRLRIASATVAGARPWGGDPDVNGDGYSDVLAAVANIGASIYVGGPTGPTATPVTVAAPLDSTHFGQAIDFAGDVNGDGYGDLVVGAPGSNGVYVYRGAATGVDPTPGLVTGPAGSGLGSAVAGAGDVNGDGFDDVVAVNPSGNAVWLVPGGVGGLGTAVRVNVPLTSTASVLAGAGDVDGDGYADVLLAGGGGSGQLLRGGVSGLDGASSVAVDRTSGAAGDLNGDGRGDLAFVSGTTARVVLGAGTIDPAGSPVAGVLAAESRVSARGGDY
ncbi:MAG: FG-GAP repeat protein, partial [Deltaproteobacteria bacterium]|nr:FG-GAP repeat protein [Deltaproteobacteria bacterium]